MVKDTVLGEVAALISCKPRMVCPHDVSILLSDKLHDHEQQPDPPCEIPVSRQRFENVTSVVPASRRGPALG